MLVWASDLKPEELKRTENEKKGHAYQPFIAKAKKVLEQNRDSGKVRVAGFLWMQGERDASYADVAAEYQANLEKLIASARKDLSAPEMWAFIGQINPEDRNRVGLETVRHARATVANDDPRAILISTEGLQKREGDKVHYGTEGQMELGRRYARAAIEALNRETK